MGHFFTRFKGYIGILTIVLSLLIAFFWETRFRENILFKEIVVLNQNVERNQVIIAEMINVIKLEENSIIDDVIRRPNEILGLEAKHFIPRGAQLHTKYFEESYMVIDKNEKLFRVPNEWLIIYPATIMRKDTIYFYPVKYGESDKPEDGPIVITKVAYVKDSVNREVIYNNDRLDASSVAASFEVIITWEQINLLKDYVYNGYKFAVLHNER